ncbi:hypothetical protein DPMN_035006 [Dreissena polymorpha]|uniref:Uncharacterized protein n=1 Tax=Dreissena polymorpha TaxID=45954 RepID=A0A9D4M6H3_DREPO|nr:hypothetical protein DPMN_035006 [Dreissena polymorpha]
MSGPNALLKAVSAGRSRQVRLLLELGSSIEEQDDCGQTPLIKATFIENARSRDKIIRTLLKRGAVVSKVDVVGRNALMWACSCGSDSDVSLLLEYADIDLDYNRVDINGQTALFHAVSSGNAATVKLMVSVLTKYGLSVDTADYSSTTPLMQAQRRGYDICQSILIYEGSANIGLSETNYEISKRDKWAVSSLRDRSKVKIAQTKQKLSQFPPIAKTNPVECPVIDNRREYFGAMAFDSDAESSSSESDDILGASLKINAKPLRQRCDKNRNVTLNENGTRKPLMNPNKYRHKDTPRIRSSLLASFENHVVESSGEDSEEDSVASTIVDGNAVKLSPPMTDLTTIYGMKQEQMSASYRKTADKFEEPVEPEREENTPPMRGRSIVDLIMIILVLINLLLLKFIFIHN